MGGLFAGCTSPRTHRFRSGSDVFVRGKFPFYFVYSVCIFRTHLNREPPKSQCHFHSSSLRSRNSVRCGSESPARRDAGYHSIESGEPARTAYRAWPQGRGIVTDQGVVAPPFSRKARRRGSSAIHIFAQKGATPASWNSTLYLAPA